jgi:hypothetical protein
MIKSIDPNLETILHYGDLGKGGPGLRQRSNLSKEDDKSKEREREMYARRGKGVWRNMLSYLIKQCDLDWQTEPARHQFTIVFFHA